MSVWRQRWLERFYDRSKGFVDGTAEFHALVHHAIPPGGRILEIGAGLTNETSIFLASRGEVWGLDPDPDVRTNTALARAFVLEGREFPLEDASFDAAVSNYVVEHVDDPEMHFREVRRVLRPGGAYVFRAPNRWHYVAIISSMTPHAVHKLVANRARALGPDAHDPYPTHYRLNTRGRVRRFAEKAGLHLEELRMIEKEPMYGLMARPLFLAFMAYERVVNSSPAFEGLRANLLVVLRRG